MSREADKYQPIMERESMQLIWEYYTNPKEWFLHNGRYSHSVILSVAFGVRKGKTDAALVCVRNYIRSDDRMNCYRQANHSLWSNNLERTL